MCSCLQKESKERKFSSSWWLIAVGRDITTGLEYYNTKHLHWQWQSDMISFILIGVPYFWQWAFPVMQQSKSKLNLSYPPLVTAFCISYCSMEDYVTHLWVISWSYTVSYWRIQTWLIWNNIKQHPAAVMFITVWQPETRLTNLTEGD